MLPVCSLSIRPSKVLANFVKTGAKIPPRHLAAGVPARILRELTDDELAKKVAGTRLYHDLARRSLATLTAVEPLTEFDPERKRLEVDCFRSVGKQYRLSTASP